MFWPGISYWSCQNPHKCYICIKAIHTYDGGIRKRHSKGRDNHGRPCYSPKSIAAQATNYHKDKLRNIQRDCACGSGRMLLAATKINRYLHFYGADLDNTCCKIALLNMLLNSLIGEIAHMNSFSNKFYTGYKVTAVLIDSFHYPYYIEFNEPEQSRIWLHDLKGIGAKSKFDKPFEQAQHNHSMEYKELCFNKVPNYISVPKLINK